MTKAEHERARFEFCEFKTEFRQEESFRRHVAEWLYASREARIHSPAANAPAEIRQSHRAFLASIIAFGEWAQLQVARHNIDLSPIGISLDVVASETRILRDTSASLYDNCLTPAEAESILKEVFG